MGLGPNGLTPLAPKALPFGPGPKGHRPLPGAGLLRERNARPFCLGAKQEYGSEPAACLRQNQPPAQRLSPNYKTDPQLRDRHPTTGQNPKYKADPQSQDRPPTTRQAPTIRQTPNYFLVASSPTVKTSGRLNCGEGGEDRRLHPLCITHQAPGKTMGHRMQDAGQDVGHSTLDTGHWTQDM